MGEMDRVLDWLIENGYAEELLIAMQGKGRFSDMRDFDSLDRFSLRLRTMTIKHLEFLIQFGDGVTGTQKTQDGHVFSAFPEYFQAWKLAGHPGISYFFVEKMYIEFKDIVKNS